MDGPLQRRIKKTVIFLKNKGILKFLNTPIECKIIRPFIWKLKVVSALKTQYWQLFFEEKTKISMYGFYRLYVRTLVEFVKVRKRSILWGVWLQGSCLGCLYRAKKWLVLSRRLTCNHQPRCSSHDWNCSFPPSLDFALKENMTRKILLSRVRKKKLQ